METINLLNAINLAGPFAAFRVGCILDPSRNWVLYYPLVSPPSGSTSFQSAVMDALAVDSRCQDVAVHLHKKLAVTLKPVFPNGDLPRNWGGPVMESLSSVSSYIKMCWLKTVAGAWCTGVRLQSHKGRGCIFGCKDTRDELCHYLTCPALWQFARDALRIQETSVFILHRLCIVEPSAVKLKTLAFCHALYHTCVNDMQCMRADGMPRGAQVVQHRAHENSNFCLHLVGGR